MAATNLSISASPVSLSSWQELLDRFDQAWRQGPPPDIEAFLPALSPNAGPADAPACRQVLEELVKIDLEYRWQQVEPPPSSVPDILPARPRLEDYGARYAELGPLSLLSISLIGEEYRVRQRWGDRPAHAEYAVRFPQHGERLRRVLVQIDAELALEPAPRDGERSWDDSPHPAGQTSASPPEPPPLARVGRYELRERLGTGSFGSVWRAWDTELARAVAVKLPRSGCFADAAAEERFLREARLTARLRHPGIVAVHDVGRDQETIYLVADLVQGVSLAQWLATNRLSFREAAELIAQVADALAHAHQQGVIHRDLKPSNILLGVVSCQLSVAREEPQASSLLTTDNWQLTTTPKITDFGLAKRDTGEITLTLDGQVLGTPAYMSPEQIRNPHTVEGRSDIYSLGVILYQLLTGELPFQGVARMVLQQVQDEDPRAPRRLNDHIPRDLETITLTCLAKEPGRRYGTAEALAADLRRWLAGQPIQARPVGRFERLQRWCRRKPAVAGLTAALGLAVVLGFSGVTWLWRVAADSLETTRQLKTDAEQRAQQEARQRRHAEQQLKEFRGSAQRVLADMNDMNLGGEEKALALQKKFLESNLKYLRHQQQQSPDDPGVLGYLVSCYWDLITVEVKMGALAESLANAENCRPVLETFIREKPDQLYPRICLAHLHMTIGGLHRVRGQFDQGARALERDRDVLERARQTTRAPLPAAFESELANYYAHQGQVQGDLAQLAGALCSSEQARAILARRRQAQGALNNVRFESAHAAAAWCRADGVPDGRTARLAQSLLPHQPGYALVLANATWAAASAQAFRSQQQARAIWERLVQENPENYDCQGFLGATWNALGEILYQWGHREEALQAYRQAIQHQLLVLARPPQNDDCRMYLRQHYANLIGVLQELDRPADAAAAAQELATNCPLDAMLLAEAARGLARCIPRVGKGQRELSPAALAERRRYADQAVQVLRQARTYGFKDLKSLQTDPAFEPLRARADFQRFIADLQEKRAQPTKSGTR